MADGTKFEFRGRCPACKNERSIVTSYVRNNPESMDALDAYINIINRYN